jgi:hypothetical protein
VVKKETKLPTNNGNSLKDVMTKGKEDNKNSKEPEIIIVENQKHQDFSELEEIFKDLSLEETSYKIKEYYFNNLEPDDVSDALFFNEELPIVKGDPLSRIGYAFHSDMLKHQNKERHCERPERSRAIDYYLTK